MGKQVRRWMATGLLLVLSLLLAEGALQIGCALVPSLARVLDPPWSLERPDSILGGSGNPYWYDHDSRGFRNARVPPSADIVIMGDSHTYGTGVARSDTWPFVVAGETRRVTYSMAFPGWGPGQGYLLLDDAFAFHPKVIVYGFYVGNDLFDVFQLLVRHPELRRFVHPTLFDSATARETAAPLAARVRYLFALGDTSGQPAEDAGRHTGAGWAVRVFLSDHSKLYATLRSAKNLLAGKERETPVMFSRDLDRALQAIPAGQREFILPYRGPEWRTLFTPDYRNLVLDDRDPRIATGAEATKGILAEMDQRCRQRGIRFVVLFLPTKEAVFYPRVPPADRSMVLDSVARNEARLRAEILTSLDSNGVTHLDLLAALSASKEQPYFQDVDGHPSAVGHRVIALAVSRFLAELPPDSSHATR